MQTWIKPRRTARPFRKALMQTQRRDQIQRSLRTLAESSRATMELMEQTLVMLCEELALDPLTYFQARPGPRPVPAGPSGFMIDRSVLSVHFRGRVCFLGNTLP